MKYLTIMLTVLLLAIACDNSSDPSGSDNIGNRDIYSADGQLISDEEVAIQLQELFDSADCLKAEVPSDACINGDLYAFSGNFNLIDDECNFNFSITKCENGCTESSEWDETAHCSNACDNMTCDNPKSRCYDRLLESYDKNKEGKCQLNEMDSSLGYCSYVFLAKELCKSECV